MSTQLHRHERQPSLRMIMAHDARARRRRQLKVILSVVRHVEGLELRRRGGKALRAVEGHVLDCEECAIVDKDHVEDAVADDDAVGFFNHAGEDAQR